MKVAVLDDYQAIAHSIVDWGGSLGDMQIEFFHDHPDQAELVERLSGFEVVVAMRERTAFPAEVLGRLPNLKLLVTTGSHNAAIDLAAAARAGVTVCGTGGSAWSAAELTWGLILAATRSISVEDASMRSGGWQRTVGRDLAGSVLGLVGVGRLGAKVASYGRAFDMEVIAWSPHLTPQRATQVGVTYASREALFQRADVVSIHLVLGSETQSLITADDLHRMKPTSYIVNTSRGPVVDEGALIQALSEGWIAGAGLDVYDSEPLPVDHPLRRLPNTVLTPHIGYVTHATYVAFYAGALEDIQAFLAGTPIRLLRPSCP